MSTRIDQEDPAERLHRLGVTAGRAGDFAAAAEWLGRAIAIAPDRATAHNDLAGALRHLGSREAALASYDRAVAVNPRYAEAYNNRGVLLNELHRWEEAVASYDRAIELRPEYAKAHCNRGLPLEHLHRLTDALDSYERAIAIDPKFATAHVNRGNVLRQLQRPVDAIESCDRALTLRPDDAPAHLNKAMALLAAGNLADGWREYEWRWRDPSNSLSNSLRRVDGPRWQGHEPLVGKTLLIHSEQGLGDTLQFCRFVPTLIARGAEVIFEAPRPLASLLESLDAAPIHPEAPPATALPGAAHAHGTLRLLRPDETPPHVDYHCPLLSLPLTLGTTLDSIPSHVPYLRPPSDRQSAWRERLGPRAKPRVGLVWSGGLRPEQPATWSVNQRRNIPLRLLAPLAHAGIEFYSLQKGQPAEAEFAEAVAAHWAGPALIDLTHLLADFADTAALVDELDLVISVDTSTAHLAGALGKPVWILDRFDTCWRWLLGRADSPWYPSARIYRQKRLGDWSSVVNAVRTDLHQRWR